MSRMGSAEFQDWIAFYELQQEDEARALEDAKRG